ncbi:MAG: bifunctional phosphopantothenoylcysteine decarboxylase/phosphopantothenate--cysteine ligase CoaBC [Deltaproteobacteria bacterium]|nr:bifunctional phosphopantothenoylcysteine decarboxylase/phosphopantothenate--cysteine ligase CoaBC [Deltaproteobacteria bacterium]
MLLNNKKIVLGITGGIAAYKAVELARLFIKNGALVWPVMTKSAANFITPLSLQTVARNPVFQDMFDLTRESRISHIDLAENADIVVIAPATANIIGKVASGIADDILTTIIMATKAPVLLAPAMNVNMYENKIVQHNIEKLKKLGYYFIGPDEGELACGYEGKGRLAPVEDILDAAEECLAPKDLKGEKVLVTAGPTREAIDPVRFISNPSSGKMGYAIARAAKRRGAEVVLVSGPCYLAPPRGITLIKTTTAEEMAEAAMRHYPQSTVVIMAAAVSDYRPKISHKNKVKKEEARFNIELERTQDILKEMGNKKRGQFLVGFALETEDILANAKKKLKEKKLDLIIANDPTGFDGEVTQVTVLEKDDKIEALPALAKNEAAERILDRVVRAVTNIFTN